MRYANFQNSGKTAINIGDYLQFLAIAHVYDRMGIPDAEIKYLELDRLVDYDGEEVVLPINYSLWDFVRKGRIAIPPKVTPVFLAIELASVDPYPEIDAFLCDEYNRGYFLRHSPIGCRDELSFDCFTRNGIPAYINGCLTATFPKRPPNMGVQDRLILADAPQALLPWIPKHLLDAQTIVASQQYIFTKNEINDYRRIFSFVRERYADYQRNARLILTSRLHVALPCIAFGIPVILAKDVVDARFAFVEKYLPIYSHDMYNEIDWSPSVPDIESLKERLIDLAIDRIRAAMGCAKDGGYLTSIFQARQRKLSVYADPHIATHKNGHRFEEYAAKHWRPLGTRPIKYGLWGASSNNRDYWKDLIESRYPNAELTAIFDRYDRRGAFGLPALAPEALADLPEVFVVVCSVGAVNDALALFARLGLAENRYCITSDNFISGRDIANAGVGSGT